MIWNYTEAPQQGLKSIKDPSPENMHSEFIDSYIFRHCGESNHTKAAELITKPAWACATDAASVTELADRGMIIHQQFPLFIAYWSVPESADSRFIMHTRLGLCITLPIPLDAMGEESLNIQQNRDIWLEEALAFVAVKKESACNFISMTVRKMPMKMPAWMNLPSAILHQWTTATARLK